MLIKSLVIKKDYLTTVNEHATLEEALKVLESSGYRCVPILDDSGKIFRGNIYKMHIYRHIPTCSRTPPRLSRSTPHSSKSSSRSRTCLTFPFWILTAASMGS